MKKVILSLAIALALASCQTVRTLPTERIIVLHISQYGDTTYFETPQIKILDPDSLRRFKAQDNK